MYVDKDSVIVNNVNLGPYLLQVDFEYHKGWGKDSGRNLAGSQKGTLVGIFPKLVCQFRKLTEAEVHLLAPILDSARQNTTYHDDNKGQKITMKTYTGDWKLTNRAIKQNEPFSCSFISCERRK